MLGVPVVFPDTGGIKEFLPSEYDFLYKQFDYESFVNKLNLLTNKKLVNKNVSNAHLHIMEKLNEVSIIEIFQEVIASNDCQSLYSYERLQFVEQLKKLESILNQTYQNIELLLKTTVLQTTAEHP